MQSVSPKQAAIWIADKRDALSDPEFVALYLEYDAAFDWPPDDPRLYALAARTQRWMADRSSNRELGGQSMQDPTIGKLIAAAGVSSPAWDRLSEIANPASSGRR